VLAYVFWHSPRWGVDTAQYEQGLLGFQRTLAADPPDGFYGCSTHRLDGVPWLDDGTPYEDWYLVADFAALGDLNEAAIEGARRSPHDQVAGQASAGIAGVYARWFGHPAPDARVDGRHRWFAKPAGMAYENLRSELVQLVPERAVVWRRQMTLGPTPEFCLVEIEPVDVPWPTIDVTATRLVGA
jgi:hypothetical protein